MLVTLTQALPLETAAPAAVCMLFLSEFCGAMAAKDLRVINEQYPFTPLEFLPKTLRLPFEEGIAMLQADGLDVCLLACLVANL